IARSNAHLLCNARSLTWREAKFSVPKGRKARLTTSTCLSCAAMVDAQSRYCPSCGSPTTAPEPSGLSLQVGKGRMARTAQERRVVTVLFADLTGSTALAERLDAEDMRGVLESLFETLAREVAKLDGA